MKYICQYCGREFTNNGAMKMHENTCKLNPDREQNLKKRKIRSDNLSHEEWLNFIEEKHPDLLNHIEILGKFIHATQTNIQIKCKHCGEIYNESLNNICRYSTWKCKNHCSHLVRRQKELNKRKENLVKTIKEKNPGFLNKFDIIGNWDGNLRSKIKVKCKNCGLINEFSFGTIISTSTYSCKGCTILSNLNFNKLVLTKNEIIDWIKQYKPKLLERLEIVNETINLLEDTKIKCKCLKCKNIIEISIGSFFRKDTKNILCPNCQKRHNETEEYLISLINSHKINNEKYICKYCGKEYKNKNALAQHECRCKSNPNKLTYNKKWICPYCGKEFNNPLSYAGHKTMCIKNPNWETSKNKRYYGE